LTQKIKLCRDKLVNAGKFREFGNNGPSKGDTLYRERSIDVKVRHENKEGKNLWI
jgi:hypothetical protein